jgi:hypothetical protein
MNEDAIKDAYNLFVNTGYNKSYDNFKALIQSNPNARKDAYDLFVSTGYKKTQKDFDQLMGIGAPAPVKKKEQVSPSQQKAQPTSLATGGEMAGGPSEPSARKRYDVKGRAPQPQPVKPTAQLTQRDYELMMPFMGTPDDIATVVGDAPIEQPNPFAEDVKRAGNILTKKTPEGDAFTAGIITSKPETKQYAKEVLTAVQGPEAPSYIEKVVNGSVAAGLLADKIAALETISTADDVDFEEIASLNKQLRDNAIEDEGGIVGFLKQLPSVIGQSMGAALLAAPSGAAGAAVGAAAGSAIPVLGTIGGAAAGFAGGTSLALEYSNSLMGALMDSGVDITDEKQLKSAFESPEKMSEARNYALKRGVPIAIFDMISGKLAGTLFKTTAGATAKQVIKAGAKETAVQAALGGAGEATAQIIADGKLDGRQIAYEMVAEPVNAIPSAAINYLGDKAKTAAEKKYVKRIETDANLKLKSDIATIVDPEIASSSKKINQYRKLKEEAVSQTAKDEYDKRISEEREKKYSAYEKFFPVFDSLSDERKQEAYNALDEVGRIKDEYNAAESTEERKILGQVLAQKLKTLKEYAVQEQATSEVPVQPEARTGEEVVEGKPQPEPQVAAEEGQEKVVIPAGKRLFNEPNPETVEISKTYKEKNNIAEPEGVKIEAVDVDNASKIADAYEALQDTPNDPEVQDAYNAMADETAKQHQDIVDAGYEVEIWQGEGEPYANAQEMIDDVKNNKHMFIYSTEQGFGDAPITEEQRKQNKLLQDSGFKDKTGKTLLYNDLFRFVHDFFGHTERGNGFGPVGEENAWDVHARMYTPKARRAMTTETRGQNSWVNFGPQMRNEDGSLKKKGDAGYLSPKDRQFAPQKMALMPEEFSQIVGATSNFDEAINKSAQSLNMVAPGLKIIIAENTDDAQMQIAEALSAVAPSQASDVAAGFTTETRGQTVFVNGKPYAMVFNKETADSVTAGHEVWETLLNDAFADDQARMKEFVNSIDAQLRAQGFEDIADRLEAFASQRGYEAVKYSEYMAELGGMLVASGFGKVPLTAQQKTLLQKIGDIINKFAQLFAGKKQFLDQATPEDILGFMITISEKVSKGEDISQFFRQEPGTIIDQNDVSINTRDSKKQKFENNEYEVPQKVYNPKGGTATGFTFIADRMRTGEWTGLNPNSGINIKLMGGIGYPMLKKLFKKAGWAVDGGSVMSSFLNKIVKSQTGVGFPVIMSEYSHVSNLTFAKIFEAEMDWMVKNKEISKKEQLDNVNDFISSSLIGKKDLSPKLKENPKTGLMEDKNANAPLRVFTTEKNGVYTPKTYKSIEDVYKELETTFGARALFMQNMIGVGVKNRYAKIDKYKFPDMVRVADETADPRLKGVPSGSAVSAIQFDQKKAKQFVDDIGSNKDLKKFHSASAVGVDPHISYEYVVEGSSLGWLPGVVDLAEAEGVEPDTKEWYDEQRAKYKEGSISEAQLRSNVTAKARASMPEVTIKTKAQKAFDESIKKEEASVKLKFDNDGQLLAPNGKPSNLNEDLARYTRTTVFKDWFGDWEKDPKNASKVVDENGEPLVVYHGSPYGGIKTFDRKESAKVSSGLKEFGTYFTTNRKVADIYASEGKISQEKINEIDSQISKLQEARDNTRSSSDFYNFEKEIEALKKNKSPKVYAAFLNLRSIKDFNAEQKSFPEAWRNLKVDAGYKTATDRDAMEFLREGKFGVKKVDGIKASDIVDIVSQGKKDGEFVGDVYLAFDSAPDAIRVVETPTVTTRSQKSVPAVVDEVLTDDGKGNYVFVHYSDEKRDAIKPMSGSKRNFTSREEVSAISSVGGVAMYYTKRGQKEQGVGNVPNTVIVPKDKVYFYGSTEKGTVFHDPEGFEEEARTRFQAYRNRGNESRPTKYAFDANNSAAWVTKVAAENGYDMLVTNWGGPKSYRAQTTKELKTEDEYTGFKEIPDDVFEVGDEVFVYSRYGNITNVDGNVLTIDQENAFGRFDTMRFTVTDFNKDKILLIEKAKPTVTTRSQRVDVTVIPGYERFLGVIEGMIDKAIKRGTSYNKTTENVIEYIQRDSAVYKRADDSQREQIIRDFVKIRGEKFKTAPSVARIMGQIKDTKEVTVKEKTALKDQIKLEAKAAKDAVAYVKQLRTQISTALRAMTGRGVISARQATTILARYDKMNILNPVMRDRFVDYMSNVLQRAEYLDKIREASKLRKAIKKASKSADNQAEVSKMAKDFAGIDPSRVEDIDQYIENATQVLNSAARKTGDPLMRNPVNMANMANYIEQEMEIQNEQIKNEILSKYQELVDAGVLSSDMTINEIKRVVSAIEENDSDAQAKVAKAKEALKGMMEEISPVIMQMVRTGEDPFTGEPIELTYDEKKALKSLTEMDLDNLSLADAVKVVEYANNFVANGITSGIVGITELYNGSLEPGKLVKKGFKSIPIRKYFMKGAGKVWAEGFATLPMLNKLYWGDTRRAMAVSEASGVTGISNGKAKALRIVDKAAKEYIAKFANAKDFLASENVLERGMVAFMSRGVIGDEFQAQDEYNRRKTLIEETIQALKDPENSTDLEIAKGEVAQKVYDKILKDSKNAEDVRSKASKTNVDAVDWWINEWSKYYDQMDEVSRNVYNTELSRDINYTPDRFQMKEAPTATEEDFESSFFGNFEYVDTSKSGSLKKNNRIKNLPEDKNGVKKRIVNLDFDINNVNALTNALVDVETAGSVMKAKGFVTSKDFSKLFSSKEDRDLYKKRIVKYVSRVKGGSYVDQNELAKMNKVINAIASFGVAKALFSLSQPLKQFVPPMLNTLTQTGRFDIAELFKGGMEFIDNSGYPIANRGIGSQGELKSINRKLVEAEKNLALRGLDGVAEFSNAALELTLKNPDIYAARASWISFYLSELKKQGIKPSSINWSTHKLNKQAADYAQSMVDSQQNISDTDMQGEIFASKQPATVFLRRALLPLMTFTLNQKTRIWADIRTIGNEVSSKEDKLEAKKSLAGALVELTAFSAISFGVKELLYMTAQAIFGVEEDDEEEEKKKRMMRQSASTAQNFLRDFFLPPIPGMDAVASGGVNMLLDKAGMSEKIPQKWFGIEDEEVRFNLYDKQNQGYLDMLGTQGIAAEKALELAGYYDMAIDGKFTKEYNGNKVEKQVLEEDRKAAALNALVMSGYYGGLLPSDIAYVVGIINKKIKKRAETAEEED